MLAYHAALIWVAVRGAGEPLAAARAWGVAGVLAGGALGCKYPALISAVVPFGCLAVGAGVARRSWRIPLAFAAGLAVAAGPWLAKNVVDTGNPVYPLGWKVFGGRHWEELVRRAPSNVRYAIQAAHWVFRVSSADGGPALAAIIDRCRCWAVAETFIPKERGNALRAWWLRSVLPRRSRHPLC